MTNASQQDTPDHERAQPAAAEQGEDAPQALLEEQVQLLQAELEQLRAQSLLERADLDNQRKRLAREVDAARRFANERLLGSLLPVFDSLDAGLAAAGAEAGPLREGLELTHRQLTKATEDHGLRVVDPVGEPFDPERHQAISQADGDGVPPGHVVQVFQKGYLLNDRLLRPALVVVAKD
ncbi:nucleotide exchange factor GrpE [Luteimonas huabeiensis]|uniref:nucleotide exchange factor GrpE n=1 Tax=Luteimonas huabeiensis TaxID=1244513 RepID=UPI00046503CF|nr:nucleotide exchange factor GrpE [Luteimonas huabeiensis]